jgi:hypothetical protein
MNVYQEPTQHGPLPQKELHRTCQYKRSPIYLYENRLGRAITKAVSRWLPTSAARVRAQVM